jgi:HSP20 family protein
MNDNRWNRGRGSEVTLRDAIDQLFQDSVIRMPRGNGGEQSLTPPADAWETQDEIVIELALPGVNPEKVDITFTADSVVINGELPKPTGEGKNWLLRERPWGPFQRRFSLGVPVNVDKVEATTHDGILTLRLPKSEAVKPRKITVKSA